jgi:cell division protein ZipA
MQANWSLVLNVVFLGVIVSMIVMRVRPMLMKPKKVTEAQPPKYESHNAREDHSDDILNIRKIEPIQDYALDDFNSLQDTDEMIESSQPSLGVSFSEQAHEPSETHKNQNIMLFLAAKGQHIFAGYELLQTLLTCGLRFGDGGLFHRHQHASGQGPVLFSLAAATATGMFDLQNIGAMSVKGLCVFMELSGNVTIDSERFQLFMQTAKHLAMELQANLLDEKQRPVTDATIAKYERLIAQEMTVDA